MQDLNIFVLKARKVKDFFEELELAEDRGDTSINFLMNLRETFDLPLPDIEFIEESERDLIADMNEIESFNIEEEEEIAESVQDESAEYLIETETIEPEIKEPMECEDSFQEAKTSQKSIRESLDEVLVHFEDDGLIFQEVTVDNDECITSKNQEYEDDIASHFE